jgi:hypothetical protein
MLGVAAYGANLAEGLIFDGFSVATNHETAPRLSIRRHSAAAVAIAWPPPALGWHLQQTVSLATTNWTAVTQAPEPVAEGWQVVLPAVPPSIMFYRLGKQATP